MCCQTSGTPFHETYQMAIGQFHTLLSEEPGTLQNLFSASAAETAYSSSAILKRRVPICIWALTVSKISFCAHIAADLA